MYAAEQMHIQITLFFLVVDRGVYVHADVKGITDTPLETVSRQRRKEEREEEKRKRNSK